MKAFRNFLDYAIFSGSVLLIFLLVFESYLNVPSFVKWLGHWHPVILHFPIVMILIVIIQYWRKDQYFEYYLGFTVFVSFLTSITGLLLSLESGEKGSLISTHQWLGISVTFILGIWYWSLEYLQNKKRIALGINSGLVILVIVTGHFGGMITHGEKFLSFKTESDKEMDIAQIPENPNIYEYFVQPILDRKCVACHNENKSKGKLLLTNYSQLVRGGESGQLLAPEREDQSLLLGRILLPMESEKHMPPKEEPQLTDDEIILLSEWIQSGASAELLFAQMDKSTESYHIIQNTISEQNTNRWDHLPEISNKKISNISSNYISIFRLFHQSNALQVIMYPHKEFKPGDVSKLKPIIENIVELSLSGLPLSDADLAIVGKMSNLQRLDLGRTNIEGGSLKQLQSLQKLQEFKIYNSNLNGNTLEGLRNMAGLETVFAYNSGIQEDELAQLFKNTGVTIVTEAEQASSFKSVLPPPMIKDKTHFFNKPFKLILEHPLEGIDIFYTLDGTLPDENSTKYNDGIDIADDAKIIYLASREGWQSSPVDSFKLFRAGVVPDEFSLQIPPNEKYPGKGPSSLFDLEKGPLTHNDSSWMAYRENSFILECRWDQPKKISEITISTFVNTFSYIFPAQDIRIIGGNDPSNSELLYQRKTQNLKEDEGAHFKYYECAIQSAPISFLKLEIQPLIQIPVWHQGKGERGWFFIDEVLIN